MIQVRWTGTTHCIYSSTEYYEPAQLVGLHVPGSDNAQHKMLKVEKADDLATHEWPYVYRVVVKAQL